MATIPQPSERLDARKKTSGKAKFVADLTFPGMLHAVILRSPHGHALINSIDISEAKKISGIEAIITGKDVADLVINIDIGDQQPIAVDKVRFMGEPVAAVLADDKWKAAEAVDLIKVEYEILPAVTDAREAMKEDSPILHEKQEDYKRHGETNFTAGTNVFSHYKLRKGKLEDIFEKADLVLENSFVYPHRSHTQIEPHGAIAFWTNESEMEMYSSTQSPFFVRTCLADMFAIDPANIIVKAGYLGGGFGGKSDVTIEPLLAAISRFVPGKYVKLTLGREEAFTGSVIARGAAVELKTAVSKEGKILGEKVKIYFNSGAYGSCSLHIVTAAGHNSSGPYEIDNMEVDAYGVYTNNPPVGAFRGYGHPEVHWAKERQINLIAKELGIDPLKVRKINLLKPGSINALGQEIELENGDLAGCVDKVAERLGEIELPAETDNLVYGKGMAAMMKSPVMATNSAASATLRFNESGSVDLAVSGVEMGQGTKTAMRQVAAGGLELPLERIKIKEDISTDNSPYGWQTIGSTTSWKGGMAVLDAVQKAIDQLKANAAAVFDVAVTEVEYADNKLYLSSDPDKILTTEEVCFGYMRGNGYLLGQPVQAYGTYVPPELTHPDPETGQGNCAAEWTFGAQGVVLSINKNTGEITVHNLITALDAGKVINPVLARNQLVGAMVQELGGALTEELVYAEDGKMRNNNFTDFKIPTPEDVAETKMEVYFFETPEPIGPFGARGIAEHGTVGIAAAVGNAISDALNIEIFNLPIYNEKVFMEMTKAGDLVV